MNNFRISAWISIMHTLNISSSGVHIMHTYAAHSKTGMGIAYTYYCRL